MNLNLSKMLIGGVILSLTAINSTLQAAQPQYYEVQTLDSRSSRYDYRPGEVIVKLRTGSSPARIRSVAGKVTASSSALNNLLQSRGIRDAESLMPLSGARVAPRFARGINGREVADADLSGLYALRFDPAKVTHIEALIDELKALPEVEYAEPNYIMHTLAAGAPEEGDFTSDPLYSQQWGIPAIGLDRLWAMPVTNSKRPVIAILDTGVDIEHPDLKDNIWTNTSEANGAEERDDDANGYADDLHGWDFVNRSARMRDNNGHGTHCAGIAAACGGNGIGISGANPSALIMPITVMQSDGTGDIATIIKGVDYAAANGADLISMSFGSYSDSQALRDALGKAYQKSVLVAAAGNDGKCIYPHLCKVNGLQGATMFPGAYSFVLGVEASGNAQGGLASFSNFDEDGPVTTTFGSRDLFNYELRAPGTSIMSTFPGGQYRKLNGTSMATPLVAGAISRLMMVRDVTNKDELFGDLINTAEGNINIFKAASLTDADRRPTLALVTYRLDDEKMGDGDGRPDAGETIRIYPTFRNSWGNARNITYSIRLSETEDPNIVEFMDGESHFISNLSSYATAEAESSFILKISPDCVDGRHISLVLTATCDNISAPLEQEITLVAENGVELGGVLREDMTLTPDKNYIVTNNFVVPEGSTLTILPGTTIKLKDGVGFRAPGHVVANGEPGNMIHFMPADGSLGNIFSIAFDNDDEISYCCFENFNISTVDTYYSIYGTFENCIFQNIYSGLLLYHNGPRILYLTKCNYYNSQAHTGICNPLVLLKSNLVQLSQTSSSFPQYFINFSNKSDNNIFNNYYGGQLASIIAYSDNGELFPSNGNYLGSANDRILRNTIIDIWTPGSLTLGEFDLSTKVERPVHDAHGIVWKVVVNDYDAQDEYELLPPLGVGRHKFEVYFNRKMNHDKAPMIAMGVRAPYTQTAIAEDGEWRTETFDGDEVDIYTAYLTIRGKDNFDGVNTIYVADAEDDEYFPIPIEDVRFHVNVQSAGSMSDGFSAEPGLGKVTLEWENPEANFDDMLGYNMYRYEILEDGQETAPARINENLLTEEALTDFDVVPGHRYCYYFKVMRTDLQENSASKVVAATPLTAAKGDADGSLSVDVADVVTEVNYMIGANPQPFIFEAADVNSDEEVDILDVVGTVNIILQPQGVMAMTADASATYSVENGVLYVDSPVALGGLQFNLAVSPDTEIRPLEALEGMETAGGRVSETEYRFLAFSLSGRTVAPGRQALLAVGDADVTDVVLSDKGGKKVLAMNADTSGIGSLLGAQMRVPSPNPFSDYLDVPVTVAAGQTAVELTLTTLDGKRLLSSRATPGFGDHTLRLDTRSLPAGFYLLTMYADGTPVQTAKVIRK